MFTHFQNGKKLTSVLLSPFMCSLGQPKIPLKLSHDKNLVTVLHIYVCD